jgi:hypothetical protein
MKANAVFREVGETMRHAGTPPKGDEKREASRRGGNPGHVAGRVSRKRKLHRPNRTA